MIKNYLMKSRRLVGVALLAGIFTAASATDGRWTEGFGQGNLEYFIDAKGWRLHIGCPTEDGSANLPSSVRLMSLPTEKEAVKFTIRVGGNVYEGPFEADSRAGANNFISLLEDLRKSDVVVQYGRTKITFPKSNVGKVVPVFGKGLQCNLG